MTAYWIEVDQCQVLVSQMRGLLDDIRTDFDKIGGDMDEVRARLGVKREADTVRSVSTNLDDDLEDLAGSKLPDFMDDLVAGVEHKVNAMQEVINYYASGDAQIAFDSQHRSDEMPEVRHSGETGYTYGHPATGHGTDTPPTTEEVGPSGDPTEPLTKGDAATHPFQRADNVSDVDGK